MKTELDAAKDVIGELAQYLDQDISVELWDGTIIPLGPNAQQDIRLIFASPAALRRLITRPSLVSVAELYAAGDLDISKGDPIKAMRHVDHVQFRQLPGKVNKARLLRKALPLLLKSYQFKSLATKFTDKIGLTRASGRDDKELISFHYDISNDFYELFLDENMVYSAAYFDKPTDTIDAAQQNKLDLICRKLRLQPGDRLFDTGCGWGSLSCHAARYYGAQVYGTTLSREQFDYTNAKIVRWGLQDRVKIELKDCRDVEGMEFDKVAQIEMIEHLGLNNHHDFYMHLGRRLRGRGLYLGQASARRMTLKPEDFPILTPYMQFIGDYIFPGGELDHIGMTVTALERALFEVHEVEALREHFALTCEHWTKRLYARRQEAAALVGMPKTRLWILYLSLCALSFQRGALNVFQVVASSRRSGASGYAFDRKADYGVTRTNDAARARASDAMLVPTA